MLRAIASGLVLLTSVCHAQDDWSYPVDPYFGVLHESEYPGDAFPIDVNFMPKKSYFTNQFYSIYKKLH